MIVNPDLQMFQEYVNGMSQQARICVVDELLERNTVY